MTSLLRRARHNPLPLLLGGVTALFLVRHLLALLPATGASSAWAAFDVMRAAGMALTLAAVLHLLPWVRLRLICFVAALMGYYVADAALCALWYWGGVVHPATQLLWQGLGFGGAAAWYLWRSYDQPSDTPGPDHVYCLRKRPKSPQDLAVSLLGCFGAQGAYAIYAAGHVYHFRKGRLITTLYDPRQFQDYVITRGRPLQLSHIVALDAMRGVEWGPLTNCVTLLATFWRRHGR